MNRNLLGLVVTVFTFGITISCSDKQTSEITGIALSDSTGDESRIVSASVTLARSSLEVGESTQATALLLDRRRQPLYWRVVWSSSNTAVATVSPSGLVTANAPGSAAITATRGWKSGSATVTVIPSTVARASASVASVSVDLPASALNVGQTTQAVATTRDSSNNVLIDRAVVWSSSDASVATISDSGLVTALVAGVTAITASSEGQTGTASLSVSEPPVSPPPAEPAAVASVSVSPEQSSLEIGATVQLLVTARDANDSVLTGRVVTSSSADAGIASVNSLGLVTAVSPGNTQITVTSEGKSAIATITVTAAAPPPPPPAPPPPAPVASVSVSPATSSLEIGATVQLLVTAVDSDNNVLTGRIVTSSSADAGIASVNSMGLVTAESVGTTQITVTSEGKSADATINVTVPAPAPVAAVSVSPAAPSLQVGATVQLTATMRDADNNVLTGRAVAWSSANTGIASVNSTSGLVTAGAVGTVQITATSEGKSSSATITVSAPPPAPVATVTVSPATASPIVGAAVQLSATTRDANGNVLTGRAIAWSSADAGIASVSPSGRVTAVAVGTVQITATSETKTGSATFDVQAAPPPPPPPPPGSSNEPSGMTVLQDRAFNAQQESPWDTDSQLSIVQDATAPKSPSSVVRFTFPTGFSGGGNSNGHTGVAFSGRRILYISYWSKYSANWYGHETGINKQAYAWVTAGYTPFVMEAEGSGSATLRPRPILQRMIVGDGNYNANLVPGAVFPRGTWFRVEIVLTGNTSGSANGSMDIYLDGVHITSVGGLQWTSGTTAWNVFELYPVWGGVGSRSVPATMTWDIDHTYLSGKN